MAAGLCPEDLLLIDIIRRERSILGAARASGISSRKCWLMVECAQPHLRDARCSDNRGAGRRRGDHAVRRAADAL